MHVPLIGCLNTHQLLPKGQGLWDCIWPFKIYSWTFLEITSCKRTESKGSFHHDVHKDIHSVEPLTVQASTHYHLLFIIVSSTMNGCWIWGLTELRPFTSPDGYRLTRVVDTMDDLYICDTHPGWHMRATQWSSLPSAEHFGTLGNPNHKVLLTFPIFPHPYCTFLWVCFSNLSPWNHLQETQWSYG